MYRQPKNPNRQKILPPDHGRVLPPGVPSINSLKELHEALQKAIFLEHFTIPPYLCALYSIKGGAGGDNGKAYKAIHSVVMEEMLHMMMAANLLIAIGGTPVICQKRFLPTYPQNLPNIANKIPVNLLKFSKDAVNTFLQIERPAERTDEAPSGKYWSIGEFYAAVRKAIHDLDKSENGIFKGDRSRQIKDKYFGGGGKLVEVYGIEQADEAISEIVGQGEGIDGSIDDGDDTMFDEGVEIAHYFRFNEIFEGRSYQSGDKPKDGPSGPPVHVDWEAVYNMIPNPSMTKFKDNPQVLQKVRAFNHIYTELLDLIEQACTKDPELSGRKI